MKPILKILLILIILVQTISCTKKPAVQTYFDEKHKISMPDSAKVKASLFVSQENIKEKLSAVLFTVPNKKYRLELSGTFGISAASILWKEDGWKIVLPTEERYMEGMGDCVFIPIYGGVDIHKFSLLFLGQRVNTLNCDNSNPSNLTLEYNDNSALAFFGKDSLRLEIKSIDTKAEWSAGTWNLNVPEKYINYTP